MQGLWPVRGWFHEARRSRWGVIIMTLAIKTYLCRIYTSNSCSLIGTSININQLVYKKAARRTCRPGSGSRGAPSSGCFLGSGLSYCPGAGHITRSRGSSTSSRKPEKSCKPHSDKHKHGRQATSDKHIRQHSQGEMGSSRQRRRLFERGAGARVVKPQCWWRSQQTAAAAGFSCAALVWQLSCRLGLWSTGKYG